MWVSGNGQGKHYYAIRLAYGIEDGIWMTDIWIYLTVNASRQKYGEIEVINPNVMGEYP